MSTKTETVYLINSTAVIVIKTVILSLHNNSRIQTGQFISNGIIKTGGVVEVCHL